MDPYNDLVPIVEELRKIVDGLQYIIDNNNIKKQPFLKSNPHNINLPQRNNIPPRKNKDKYLPKNPDKPKKVKKPKENKPPKAPKPPKIKNFKCYHENCQENFPVWKLARMHMVEKHQISKPKYKRAKDFPIPNNETSQKHCLPTNGSSPEAGASVAADCC